MFLMRKRRVRFQWWRSLPVAPREHVQHDDVDSMLVPNFEALLESAEREMRPSKTARTTTTNTATAAALPAPKVCTIDERPNTLVGEEGHYLRALFDFDANEAEDLGDDKEKYLSFREGDIIRVLQHFGSGLYFGSANGVVGLVGYDMMEKDFGLDSFTARVANLEHCEDSGCAFAPASHLSVKFRKVALQPGNATAISYTWGEFERKKRFVGHMHGESARIELELGKEWVLEEFIDRLAEIAKDGPVWIDQLCIPQRGDLIRQTLARIPLIFQSFDVAVLMPGRPCKCLDDFLGNHLKNILVADDKTEGEKQREMMKPLDQCLNVLAPSSWFSRMWTRQELMYSRRIHCIWTSVKRAKCVPPDAVNRTNLEPYMALLHEQLEMDGVSERWIRRHLRGLQKNLLHGAVPDMSIYLKGRTYDPSLSLARTFLFFGGETLQQGPATQGDDLDTLAEKQEEFRTHLKELGRVAPGSFIRKATHSRDYVISVWIECPLYKFPKGYTEMGAPELFDDAMTQMRRNLETGLLTYAPRGLFNAEDPGSALFDAIQYFSVAPIRHVASVYEPMCRDALNFIFVHATGTVPLRFSDTPSPALSYHAEGYTAFSARFGKKACDLVPALQDVFSHCLERLVDTVSRYHDEFTKREIWALKDGAPEPEHGFLGPLELIKDLARKNEFVRQRTTPEWLDMANECDDIFDDILEVTLYDFMALYLGINSEVCRAAGVAIMVDTGDPSAGRPPRIGFFRGDVDLKDLERGSRGALTVAMTDPADSVVPLFEAYKVEEDDSESLPKYRVFGVWIPTAVTKAGEYGASVVEGTKSEVDAVLI